MSALMAATEQQVTDVLVKSGVLSANKLDQARLEASKQNEALLSYLVKHEYITDEQLTKANATVNKIPYVNLTSAKVDPGVLKLLPPDIANRYMAVPLGEMQHKLVVAMLDPNNIQAVDFLSNRINRPLKVYAASEKSIRQVLKQYDARLDTSAGEIFSEDLNIAKLSPEATDTKDPKSKANKAIKTLVEDSPISKALSAILEFAARNRASDIHIEPTEKDLRVRCRIDGVLREIMRLPKDTEPAFISRIKIISNLKIDEHRIPQDGQYTFTFDNKEIDLRISIAPIVWGEQVVIRLLDKSGTSLKLEDMGYKGRALKVIREGLKRPNGMILTSGPTGSGKSTSLYALLQEIKDVAINIVTLEDPVEYKMDGINQIQVNPDVGLTFASGLRSILRQDPDVIMVGEIRDKETAQLAVQAALTGHLVFSTLHTNSAAGILPRLLDMGVEPFLIASTVNTVIGQRLVRRIAETGKESYTSSELEAEAIRSTIGTLLPKTAEDRARTEQDLGYKDLPLFNQTAYTLAKGTDSSDNPGGYKGRMGLYEVFTITEPIQELIMKRATSTEIERLARSEGMITMRQDGYLKALNGMTTLSEVNRVAAEDNTNPDEQEQA
ncbi:MAG TPA: ATPase, T2SS/T4P/T4SS family [Candidatus Saccharimonadales bacterium]|nr:ATPase, T2SS/T4P/T4SS family [Candidatus Saccharimonadales bacterium]